MQISPNSWKELGIVLELDPKTLDEINHDHITIHDKLYHMLFKWSHRNTETTLQSLVDAVEETGEKLDPEKVCVTSLVTLNIQCFIVMFT